ncbi:NifU family protein [Ureaplasma ceti]|uniref:NifU family protein n=1 Tax=Ureaplasma ceti TaxID=3119530 RepID=A0ABP9U5D4_9BACT
MNETKPIVVNVEDRVDEIKEIIDTIRMYIQQDGGDVEFVGVENNIVTVKLMGACVGCGMTDITYQQGLQEILRDDIEPTIEVNLVY